MITDRTAPSETVTRKDDDVGSPGGPAVAGGRQSTQQAEITDMGAQGRSDADRRERERCSRDRPGTDMAPPGGSSGGHSDQMSSSGTGRKVADGQDQVEEGRD